MTDQKARDRQIAARILLRLRVAFPSFGYMLDKDPKMSELAIDEWASTMEGIPEDRLVDGFEKLRSSGRDRAPSAPEFAKLCGGRPGSWHLSWDGIKRKGIELGIAAADYECEASFANAVLKAGGMPVRLPRPPEKPKDREGGLRHTSAIKQLLRRRH